MSDIAWIFAKFKDKIVYSNSVTKQVLVPLGKTCIENIVRKGEIVLTLCSIDTHCNTSTTDSF